MGEILDLSFGPQANYLLTDYYNLQSSYFVYTKEEAAKSFVDPKPRFVFGAEYTPRSIFFDFKNSFTDHLIRNANYEPVNDTQPSDYEVIKSNSAANESWTKKLQVPIHPKSLNVIPDWEFDSQAAPYGKLRGAAEHNTEQFDDLHKGQEQLSACAKATHLNTQDHIEEVIRPSVEKCDNLQGMNLVTDLGGWGGFSSGMLELIRDDLLGKKQLYTWLLTNPVANRSLDLIKSRVEILAAHTTMSDLVMPVELPHSGDFAANSASFIPYFETINLMFSLRPQYSPITMLELTSMLNTTGNIVDLHYPTLPELKPVIEQKFNLVKIFRQTPGNDLFCPQPWTSGTPHMNHVTLEVNDRPLNLRKLKFYGDHDFKELVYDLTETYI